MPRPSPSSVPPHGSPDFAEEPTQRRSGPSHDALPPGTRFMEYELVAVLGEGRSGIVYRATDHGLQRQVAIKEYLPAALACRGEGLEVILRSDRHMEAFSAGLESFVNEARLLARFDHPALVRVYRFWEANNTAYMAMPFYDGVPVDVARQGTARPPDETWLRALLLPLLDALEVLHANGCYHCDISPQNILLQPDGRPVLLESGVARQRTGEHPASATVVLHPGFAPIEQYADSTQFRQGPWTDLYALAAVAYYCVGGRPPPAASVRALDDQLEPLSEMADRLALRFPELNYGVPFVSAIERALRVRPQERPQSVAEFRRLLLDTRARAEPTPAPPRFTSGESNAAPAPPPTEGPSYEDQTERGDSDDAHDPALWAALEAALGPDAADMRGFGDLRDDAKAAGRRRWALFAASALVLAALGAGGWMMISEYREAHTMRRVTVPGAQPGERSAAALAPPATVTPSSALPQEPPAPLPSDRSADTPAEAPPGAASAAASAEPAQQEAVADERPAPGSPARHSRIDKTLPRPERKEPDNPRAQCSGRSQFSLYRCMKAQCERSRYYEHPECRYLRAHDEVTDSP